MQPGNEKPYGHPVAFSREAEERGIAGLHADLYCPACDRVHDLIVVEFKRPTSDKLAMWAGAVEPTEHYAREDVVRCPGCGRTDLLLGPEEGREVPCPRCSRGRLKGEMEWIS